MEIQIWFARKQNRRHRRDNSLGQPGFAGRIFALDSAVVKKRKLFNSHVGFSKLCNASSLITEKQ